MIAPYQGRSSLAEPLMRRQTGGHGEESSPLSSPLSILSPLLSCAALSLLSLSSRSLCSLASVQAPMREPLPLLLLLERLCRSLCRSCCSQLPLPLLCSSLEWQPSTQELASGSEPFSLRSPFSRSLL